MKKAIIIIGGLALMLSFSAPKKQVFVVKTHPDLVEIYTKKYFALGCNLTAAFPKSLADNVLRPCARFSDARVLLLAITHRRN